MDSHAVILYYPILLVPASVDQASRVRAMSYNSEIGQRMGPVAVDLLQAAEAANLISVQPKREMVMAVVACACLLAPPHLQRGKADVFQVSDILV